MESKANAGIFKSKSRASNVIFRFQRHELSADQEWITNEKSRHQMNEWMNRNWNWSVRREREFVVKSSTLLCGHSKCIPCWFRQTHRCCDVLCISFVIPWIPIIHTNTFQFSPFQVILSTDACIRCIIIFSYHRTVCDYELAEYSSEYTNFRLGRFFFVHIFQSYCVCVCVCRHIAHSRKSYVWSVTLLFSHSWDSQEPRWLSKNET